MDAPLGNKGSVLLFKTRRAVWTRERSPTRLIPRMKAFEARGIWIESARRSWSGVRKADGMVVFALWAQSIESQHGGCCYLLWAPNSEGGRPWSDTAGGRERLEHCKAALERGAGEGFLVRGERLEGRLPEDRAKTVRGADPDTTIACLLYTSPSPRDRQKSRMPSSA